MQLRLKAQDDTMMTFAFSTDPNVTAEDYKADKYEMQWAIFVPREHYGVTPDGDWYLTTAALSLNRSEVMVGRATLVWRVIKLNSERTARERVRWSFFFMLLIADFLTMYRTQQIHSLF